MKISSYFHGKSHFKDIGMQNYLGFQPDYKCFKAFTNSDMVIAWKSQGLPRENNKPPATSYNSINTGLNYIDNVKTQLKVAGNCLQQQ